MAKYRTLPTIKRIIGEMRKREPETISPDKIEMIWRFERLMNLPKTFSIVAIEKRKKEARIIWELQKRYFEYYRKRCGSMAPLPYDALKIGWEIIDFVGGYENLMEIKP